MKAEIVNGRLSRRALIAGGLVIGATPLLPQFTGSAGADFGFAPPDMTSVVVRPMVFPVDGPVYWSDTYGACRDGCARHHEGQDLMGQKLEKLVACVSGTVVAYKYGSDGNYLYIEDADGWYYGYLHINNDTPGTDDGANPLAWAFAPGVTLGSRVRQGQHIGYLGDSGNAETTDPHLHYEIRKPSDAWYHASSVNAKYSLDAAPHVRAGAGVTPETFTPWTTSTAFVTQQYVDFVGRRPNTSELSTWTGRLDKGDSSPSDLVAILLNSPGPGDVVRPLIRLYAACFNRPPDTNGLMRWIWLVTSGTSLDSVADQFCASNEFRTRYGSVSNSQFVDRVYRNVLGRDADAGGKAYWVGQMAAGLSRGRVMRFFAESIDNQTRIGNWVRVCQVYVGMLGRSPDLAGFMYWLGQADTGTPLQSLIGSIQTSSEYAHRFGATLRSVRTAAKNAPQHSNTMPSGASSTGSPVTSARAPSTTAVPRSTGPTTLLRRSPSSTVPR